jgi:hypothetical protein
VIFTGQFVGENTLIRQSHLSYQAHSGCPEVDQFGRCSDPAYFAAGNMLHPVDTGDRCYQEGLETGARVALALADRLPAKHCASPITHDPRIRLTTPNTVAFADTAERIDISLRTTQALRGELVVRYAGEVLHLQSVNCLAEQRVVLKNIAVPLPSSAAGTLEVAII